MTAGPRPGPGPGPVQLWVNGSSVVVPVGASVAAAVAQSLSQVTPFRRSRSGTPRAPLCGMGVCFECRVAIDGAPHQRACMILARDSMRVRTDD